MDRIAHLYKIFFIVNGNWGSFPPTYWVFFCRFKTDYLKYEPIYSNCFNLKLFIQVHTAENESSLPHLNVLMFLLKNKIDLFPRMNDRFNYQPTDNQYPFGFNFFASGFPSRLS